MRLKTISARHLAQLLGKMNAKVCIIPPSPLFYCHLQMALYNTLERNNQNYKALMTVTTECLNKLDWWNNHMLKWNGKSLLKEEIDLTIDSDASLTGWGAHCSHQSTGGAWSCQEAAMHINCLELLAATLAVESFAKHKSRISILLRIDNTTVVAYIYNPGGTVSSELVHLMMWCLERNIHITAQTEQIEEVGDPEGDEPLFIDAIKSSTEVTDRDCYTILSVEGTSIKFKVDTGSQVNILPSSLYHTLSIQSPLKQCNTQLTSYSGGKPESYGLHLFDLLTKTASLLCSRHSTRPNLGFISITGARHY